MKAWKPTCNTVWSSTPPHDTSSPPERTRQFLPQAMCCRPQGHSLTTYADRQFTHHAARNYQLLCVPGQRPPALHAVLGPSLLPAWLPDSPEVGSEPRHVFQALVRASQVCR